MRKNTFQDIKYRKTIKRNKVFVVNNFEVISNLQNGKMYKIKSLILISK